MGDHLHNFGRLCYLVGHLHCKLEEFLLGEGGQGYPGVGEGAWLGEG